MVSPVDVRNVAGFTVNAKAMHVMAEDECNILYGSHKKVKMVEGVVINVDLQITNQRRKQLYVIADYKNPDGSVKRSRVHIKSLVARPVIVPVPFNIPATAPLLTATTTNIVPTNPSTGVPADNSNPVDPEPVPTITTTTVSPALIPTTTTVPANCPTIFSPAPEPNITITFPSNPPTHVVPEPDTTTTTRVCANPRTQNSPVPYPTPPPQNPPVPDLTPHLIFKMLLYLIQLHLLLVLPMYLIQLRLLTVLLRCFLIVMD